MITVHRGLKRVAKAMFRTGYVLAIALVWQTTHSPAVSQFGSNVQNFPQVVVNDGSITSFTIHNPDVEKTIDVAVQLYEPNGNAMADEQVELGPGATQTVSFGDSEASLKRGWAELKSEDNFIATELFQLSLGGVLKPRVGVLPSPLAEGIKFVGFINDEFRSGVAVHNPSPTEATEISLRLKDNAGQEPVMEKTVNLKPLQSEAAFLNDALFFGPALSSFEGVVEISVNSPPVAVLSLIQEQVSGDVATVAVETQSFVVTGATNTAIGRGALGSNTTGINNTATGASALMSNTTGFGNTASGHNALRSNTEGIGNTASGNSALAANTSGSSNTASGAGALFRNTSGRGNTASGHDALFSNTTGGSNTASGDQALRSNTEGIGNTAGGNEALRSNIIGNNNTASGNGTLFHNTTGSDNTASGAFALTANTEGFGNTASGLFALTANTEGVGNTASGLNALGSNTTGSSNVAFGNGAGSNVVTGNKNIHIGNVGAEESNTIRIGNSDHTSAFIAGVPFALPSSKRFKEDIHDMNEASNDLMRLRPVTFRYKKEYDKGDSRMQYGLIAEEVAEVYPELIVNDGAGEVRTVVYQKLNVMLLNEVKKQHRQIQDLKGRLARMEKVLTAERSLAPTQ